MLHAFKSTSETPSVYLSEDVLKPHDQTESSKNKRLW